MKSMMVARAQVRSPGQLSVWHAQTTVQPRLRDQFTSSQMDSSSLKNRAMRLITNPPQTKSSSSMDVDEPEYYVIARTPVMVWRRLVLRLLLVVASATTDLVIENLKMLTPSWMVSPICEAVAAAGMTVVPVEEILVRPRLTASASTKALMPST